MILGDIHFPVREATISGHMLNPDWLNCCGAYSAVPIPNVGCSATVYSSRAYNDGRSIRRTTISDGDYLVCFRI